MMPRVAASVLALLCAVPSLPVSAAADDPARAVVAAAATKLETLYVFPARARQAAALVRGNAERGAYDGLRDAALGDKVTADLRGVLHDVHVHLVYSADVNPPDDPTGKGPSAAERAQMELFDRLAGYGIGRVAHLPANVGYLDLRMFAESANTAAVVDAAVNAVAYSDVIVLDLRRNRGGDPKTVARLLSHFLPPKTHLNDFVGRGDESSKVVESTYTGSVPGPRITAPLFVLTSDRTFSGGEECAYDVQSLKRGTLVGAVTGGGANPGDFKRIDDHFSIFVPEERARNPITMTNWEGTGVKPDIEVPADRALVTAYGMALDELLRATTLAPSRRTAIAALRARVTAMDDAQILAL